MMKMMGIGKQLARNIKSKYISFFSKTLSCGAVPLDYSFFDSLLELSVAIIKWKSSSLWYLL